MKLHNINKILLINLGGIGDLILSTSAVKPLREKYIDSQMDLLVVERCVELMKSYGFFNNIYVYPETKNILKIINLLLKLRKNKYDLVINMRTVVSWLSAVKMFFVFKIINGRISAGRNTSGKGFFFDIKIPEKYLGEKLEYEYDVDLVKYLGVEIKDINIYVPYTDADIKYVEDLLKKNNIFEKDFLIGINSGGQQSRRWPEQNFIELIKKINNQINCKIILTGSESEKGLCQNIIEKVNNQNIFNFAGLTTIKQLTVLMTKFKFFISNDTGPMHICVVMNTPGIFIFGPGQISRYAPYKNKDKYKILYKPVKCSPCEKEKCKKKECLKNINVEEVYKSVIELKEYIYQ